MRTPDLFASEEAGVAWGCEIGNGSEAGHVAPSPQLWGLTGDVRTELNSWTPRRYWCEEKKHTIDVRGDVNKNGSLGNYIVVFILVY